MWRTFADRLLDAVYPPRCVSPGCVSGGAWLCPSCLSAVCPIPQPACRRCSVPLVRAGVCTGCRRSPPPFRRATAAGVYAGVLRHAVHALKYERLTVVADVLGEMAAKAYGQPCARALVVPVPSHATRTEERGVDHARLVAAAVARTLGRPMVPDAVVRCRATAPQVGLGLAARRDNVDGAFAVTETLAAGTVVLVDDVLTTGATAASCASALLAAGADAVDVCTVARALAGTVVERTAQPL